MQKRNRGWGAVALAMFALACGDDDGPGDAGLVDSGQVDAAVADANVADSGNPDAGQDAAPEDAGIDAGLGQPCRGLEELYVDEACEVLAPGILAYTPRFLLWSDGSAKERYVLLPPDTQIDTRDPDNWVYPVGTKIWKNFVVGETRVETRLLEKRIAGTGAAAWSLRTFGWNAEQTQATELMDGAENVLGTEHDIPDIAACVQCHADRGPTDVILGFTAIQLNHTETATTLAELNERGWVSPAVDLRDADVPGDADAQAALGYMHANCGHCHGGVAPQVGLGLWVNVADERVEDTAVWRTAVGVPSAWRMGGATQRIAPGDADGSTMIFRMNARGRAVQMPPIATEIVHPEGVEVLTRWVNGLPSE